MVLLWAKNIRGDSGLTAVKSLCTSPLQKKPRNQCFSPPYEQWSKQWLAEVPDNTTSSRSGSSTDHFHPKATRKQHHSLLERTAALQECIQWNPGAFCRGEHTWFPRDSCRDHYNITALQTFWQLLRSQETWNGRFLDVVFSPVFKLLPVWRTKLSLKTTNSEFSFQSTLRSKAMRLWMDGSDALAFKAHRISGIRTTLYVSHTASHSILYP